MATARDPHTDVHVRELLETDYEEGLVDLGKVNPGLLRTGDHGRFSYFEAEDLWLDEREGFAVYFDEAFACLWKRL